LHIISIINIINMFIILVNYKVSIAEIEKNLVPHVEFLKKQYKAGNFMASGRRVPRTGGVVLSNMKDKTELEEILNQDPFKINNLADFEIIEFVPNTTNKQLSFLMD